MGLEVEFLHRIFFDEPIVFRQFAQLNGPSLLDPIREIHHNGPAYDHVMWEYWATDIIGEVLGEFPEQRKNFFDECSHLTANQQAQLMFNVWIHGVKNTGRREALSKLISEIALRDNYNVEKARTLYYELLYIFNPRFLQADSEEVLKLDGLFENFENSLFSPAPEVLIQHII